MVLWLQKHFSFVNAYDSKGCFFVKARPYSAHFGGPAGGTTARLGP